MYRIFAPPRSLSQLVTSFVASESQGIHHAPFLYFLEYNLVNFSLSTSMSKNLYSISDCGFGISDFKSEFKIPNSEIPEIYPQPPKGGLIIPPSGGQGG